MLGGSCESPEDHAFWGVLDNLALEGVAASAPDVERINSSRHACNGGPGGTHPAMQLLPHHYHAYLQGQPDLNGWRGQPHTGVPPPLAPVPHAMQQALMQLLRPPMQPQPACEFCGRWLSQVALDQGNHMCDASWAYNDESHATGSAAALLVGGVGHLTQEQMAAFLACFPATRRVRHRVPCPEFNGLFTLGSEQAQAQALRLLASCGVRTLPLGHAASWRCLHVQLALGNAPMLVGQAETILLRALELDQRRSADAVLPSALGQAMGGLAPAAGGLGAPPLPPQQLFLGAQQPALPPAANGPGSAPGDWKCTNCGNINFAFREKCNRCNIQRPGAKLHDATARRICPYTVMLMRLPPHAAEAQVTEALRAFGEVSPGGVKFHRQGVRFKQRWRGRLPAEGLPLHAFCRFVQPASASAALQQRETLVLGYPVQINPAFLRGASPPERCDLGALPPLLHEGLEHGVLPLGGSAAFLEGHGAALDAAAAAGLWSGANTYSDGTTSSHQQQQGGGDGGGPYSAASQQGSGGGAVLLSAAASASPPPGEMAKVGDLPCFLAVLFQALWFLEPFRLAVGALPRGNDPILSGVQMLMGSLFGQRAAAPLALLHAALAPRVLEQARLRLSSLGDASACFEAALSVLFDSADARFVACLEGHFRMSIMEMCECSCGELLKPVSYTQCASYASVSLVTRDGASLTTHLSTAAGPDCPVATCGSRMRIQRYLMQPMPAFLTVALVRDPLYPAEACALLDRVELTMEVHRAFKGVSASTQAVLAGLICRNGPRHCGFFVHSTQRTWQVCIYIYMYISIYFYLTI